MRHTRHSVAAEEGRLDAKLKTALNGKDPGIQVQLLDPYPKCSCSEENKNLSTASNHEIDA